MKSRGILSFLSLFGVLDAALAQTIPNWPAPPFWSPPASAVSRDVSGEHIGSARVGLLSASSSPLPFIAITPCRVVDTRGNGFTGAYGPPALVGNGPARAFDIPGGPCPGIPAGAGAYSINVAAILPASDGFMTVFPTGVSQPASSDLNFLGGEVIANALIAPAGAGGSISIFVNVSTHMILDINGYYAAAGAGARNTFLGLSAGNFTMTGEDNTGLGYLALAFNNSGASNTAVGSSALADNFMGSYNTAVGQAALRFNDSGNFNTGVGLTALALNTAGGQNTGIGYGALVSTTGSTNIALGYGAGTNLSTGSNNICIGNAGVVGESNTLRIGSGVQTATFVAGISGQTSPGGVPVGVNSAGKLGTTASSRRFKEGIRDIGAESDGLMRLRPVVFRYKRDLDPTGLVQYGLIAEEVAEVYPDLVAYGKDGQPEAVRYHLINPLLLNEVQKQHRMIEELGARLANLEGRLTAEAPASSVFVSEEKP
jgi:endosialidase-like protein